MRGVSLLVWPLVWIGPACIIGKQSQSVKDQLAKNMAKQIKREVASDLDDQERD